jgi:hypothetical protein
MKRALIILLIFSTLISCNSINEKPLSERLDKEVEYFKINNSIDTLIEGKEGTIIFIEKESFINKLGNTITDSIEVTLKEIYHTSDIITQNISMKSEGNILETAGMIELKAYSNNDELELRFDKDLIVHFPKKGINQNMNLFYGVSDSSDIVEWKLEESSTYRLLNIIQIWYTKYEFIDYSTLYLSNGRNAQDTLYQHFDFTEDEIEELLNKTVDATYFIFDDGEMEFMQIKGSKISRKLKEKITKKVKSFPRCKPYTIEGDPIDMPGFFKTFTKVIPPKYKSKENYIAQLEDKLKASNSTKKGLELAELQYYIFDSRNLGWMNCDKFIDSLSERIDYVVEVPRSKNVFAKIVFRNYKTVMTGNEKSGKFIFENLPLDEAVKIVVIDEKRGKPLLKIVDTKTSKKPIEILKLTEYTFEELQEKLKELN